jgi:hypothetical protein
VVNDLPLAHAVLPNENVRWAEPTAAALAAALGDAVTAPDIDDRARRAAESVSGRSWSATSDALVGIIEKEAYGAKEQ